jgi:flavin reductase (DIM6/NTAB) family NADH-FMN oxidoreductase RutF
MGPWQMKSMVFLAISYEKPIFYQHSRLLLLNAIDFLLVCVQYSLGGYAMNALAVAEDFDAVLPDGACDPAVFKAIFGGFPAGVTVVTAIDRFGAPVGLTVSAVMSISLDPPLLAVCLQKSKYTVEAIQSVGAFAVNFLADSQDWISNEFARSSEDKFSKVPWMPGSKAGSPLLEGARAHAECAVYQLIDAGDHMLLLGKIVEGAVCDKRPLAWYNRQYVSLVGK